MRGPHYRSTPCPSQTPPVSPPAVTGAVLPTRSTAAARWILFTLAARPSPFVPDSATSTVAPLLPTARRPCCRTQPAPTVHGTYMKSGGTSAVHPALLVTAPPGQIVLDVPIPVHCRREPSRWPSFPPARVSPAHSINKYTASKTKQPLSIVLSHHFFYRGQHRHSIRRHSTGRHISRLRRFFQQRLSLEHRSHRRRGRWGSRCCRHRNHHRILVLSEKKEQDTEHRRPIRTPHEELPRNGYHYSNT